MARYGETLRYAREALTELAAKLDETGRLDELGSAVLDEEQFAAFVDEFGVARAFPGWDELEWSRRYANDVYGWAGSADRYTDRYMTNYINSYIIGFAEGHLSVRLGVEPDEVSYELIDAYLKNLNEEERKSIDELADKSWEKRQAESLGPKWERWVEMHMEHV